VELARARSYDVIFMAVQMPGMDGCEASTRIRRQEDPLGRHTPIVAMTDGGGDQARQEYLAAGMDAVVAKPLLTPALVAVLHEATGIIAAPPLQSVQA
jgi:CheY-like chemotaxis protein